MQKQPMLVEKIVIGSFGSLMLLACVVTLVAPVVDIGRFLEPIVCLVVICWGAGFICCFKQAPSPAKKKVSNTRSVFVYV